MRSLHWKKTLMNVLIIIATTIGILFCFESSKRKARKSMSRRHRYHEDTWRISKRLCSLQEMDQ